MNFLRWLISLFARPSGAIRVMSMDELGEIWGAGGDAPKPDPNIGLAAKQQAETGAAQLQLGEDQLAYTRANDAKWAPFYEKLANQQFDTSQQAADQAKQTFKQYTDTFVPVENRVAADATNWDSAGGLADARGNAIGTTNAAFDASQGITDRNLARAGVSASSGRSVEGMNMTGNARALAAGGAATDAATSRQLQGISLRQSAADLGRGIASGGNAASMTATGAGQGATGTLGAQTQNMNSGLSAVSGLYSGAANSYGGSANTLSGLFGNQMAGYNADQARTGAYVGAGASVAASGIAAYAALAGGAVVI